MTHPEHARDEARELHRARLNKLIGLGIYDLIPLHGGYEQIEGDIMGINSEFNGDPSVRLRASRSKQGQGVFYREIVKLEYDGEKLSINGAHQIFLGQIPTDEEARMEVVGGAIKEAFENPKRVIITDFDPRKFY